MMGIAIYVQGYEKNNSYIRGQIESLGLYEVDLDLVSKHRIPETEEVINNDLESFYKLKDLGYEIGCCPDEVKKIAFFLESIPSCMDGWGFRSDCDKTFVVMYHASNLLSMVSTALELFDKYSKYLRAKNDEVEELLLLKNILELISSKGGIVGLHFG